STGVWGAPETLPPPTAKTPRAREPRAASLPARPREGGDPDSLDSRLRGNERRTAAATRPRVSGFTNLGCRKRAPGRFRCFRIVFYNEWRNFNVWVPSARSDAAAAWLPGPPALREARLSYGAALGACCEHADVITEELGMS